MFLHDLGHTVGALTWKQTKDPAMQEVIRQKTENKFPFMGAIRSMGEYYDGYGFITTLALLFIAAILWIASTVTPMNVEIIKKILVVASIILLFLGILELVYFFPFAASFSLFAFLLTTIATLRIGKLKS